jgi:adenylosuccinate lyase
VPPEVETLVAAKLGLRPDPASSQIIQRDRHAELFGAMALLGSSIEKFAVEIRHLQRTEVREVEEPFSVGQKGSSAMPHKRNPIQSENLTGLARLLRGYALSALEDVPLWHERDISHSSVERIIAPDGTVLLDFMLVRFAKLVRDLKVYPQRMRQNLELTKGVIFSQRVLLELARRGVARQSAYVLVQRNALRAIDEGQSFKAALEADPEVGRVLPGDALAACFDLDVQLRHVDTIFARVFGQ